jgi:hypothetical protein
MIVILLGCYGNPVDVCSDAPTWAQRAARGGWRWSSRFVRHLYVATCTAPSCRLEYSQLLATKEIVSRDTVGIGIKKDKKSTQ